MKVKTILERIVNFKKVKWTVLSKTDIIWRIGAVQVHKTPAMWANKIRFKVIIIVVNHFKTLCDYTQSDLYMFPS